VLDDLHFADEGSIAVLVRLAALAAARPWLILAGVRPGEGPPALGLALTELVAQGQAGRLDLAPLSREAVGALVATLRGTVPADDELTAIHRDSGGNPWFVAALARGVGAVSAARDRLLLRLERLEEALPGVCSVLASLAPAGEPLPHAVVSRRFGGDSAALRRMMRALRDHGMLHETEDGGWQFRHELLRRALLEELLEVDRRDAHRALAEALEGEDGRAAMIAMHYAAAADPEAALALRDAGELTAAYRALRDLGATTTREQVAALLRATDQPVPRRTRATTRQDGLTETELQVCRLAVAGESNEAIALRLTVSLRTVETHLTHIYRKTGTRGRAALAIWWIQREGERHEPAADR
jgi:DNA-binding NarL/FixJ family response regulator